MASQSFIVLYVRDLEQRFLHLSTITGLVHHVPVTGKAPIRPLTRKVGKAFLPIGLDVPRYGHGYEAQLDIDTRKGVINCPI